MPKRQAKRKTKMRGSRFHGFGNVKNKRGSGCRGGVGNAGLHKHKFSWVTRYDPGYGHVTGFVPRTGVDVPCINLYEINAMAEMGKLKSAGGKLNFEFRGKILGSGVVRHPITLKAFSWSKIAEKKIKAAGGDLSKLE